MQAPFTDAVQTGFAEVAVVRAARELWHLSKHDRLPKLSPVIYGIICCALVGGLPLLLQLLLVLAYDRWALHSAKAVGWVAAFSALAALALMTGWFGWLLLGRAARHIDHLLQTSPNHNLISEWLLRSYRGRRQTSAGLLAATGSVILLASVAHAVSRSVEINFMSYITVAWVGAIGGSGVYWLFVLAGLAHQILRAPCLNLVWHSPSSTLGLQLLSGGYVYAAVGTLIAAIAAELLALTVPNPSGSGVLASVIIAVPAVAVLLALLVGLLPHYWLYVLVRDYKRDKLAELRHDTETVKQPEERLVYLETYRLVEQAPGLPFSATAMVQYAATALGSLLGFLLAR